MFPALLWKQCATFYDQAKQMAETIDKRLTDLEQVVAHLPEDLDARFAGVDTKLAAIREVQALHTTRFTTLEQKLNQLAAATAEILRRLTAEE